MSQIITCLQCENCKHMKSTFISFGHPYEDFDFKWKCESCESDNTYEVKAMPDGPEWIIPYSLKKNIIKLEEDKSNED